MQTEPTSLNLPRMRMMVMNGQRIIQKLNGEKWEVVKVAKAQSLKPGFYNLFQARPPTKTEEYEGVILHSDARNIFQHHKGGIVVHTVVDFDKVPEIGSLVNIKYDAGMRAVLTVPKLGQKQSRAIAH